MLGFAHKLAKMKKLDNTGVQNGEHKELSYS